MVKMFLHCQLLIQRSTRKCIGTRHRGIQNRVLNSLYRQLVAISLKGFHAMVNLYMPCQRDKLVSFNGHLDRATGEMTAHMSHGLFFNKLDTSGDTTAYK